MPLVARSALAISLLLPLGTVAEEQPAKPKFTISKETTFITEPLTEDGYPDYAAALNQRLGRGVTAENNANVLFWRAHGPHPERATMPAEFFKLMGIMAPAEEGDYFLNLPHYLHNHLKIKPGDEALDKIFDQQGEAADAPWTTDKYPHIAGWLKHNEKALAVVIEGTKRPKYFSPIVHTKESKEHGLVGVLLPAVQSSRSFARALAARAMLNVGEGRIDQAWQDLLSCHRLGRLLGQGPTLVEGLVGIAIDGIASNADLAFIEHTRPMADQARRYLRDVESLPMISSMVDKIASSERFMFLDATTNLARGLAPIEDLAAIKKHIDEAKSLDWDTVLRIGNKQYDRLVKTLQEKDRAKMKAQLKAMERELQDLAKHVVPDAGDDPGKAAGKRIAHVLISMFIPALQAVKQAEDRMEQMQRNLRVALALAAYNADHRGYPKKLDALCPRYLTNVPDDVFSAKPLIYKPSDDGYLLYSIGPNGEDEGGRWYDSQIPGDDPAVRVPRNK